MRARAQVARFALRHHRAQCSDPRGCALESVWPRASRGCVQPPPVGSEDLPERQERRRERRCAAPARPHVHISARRAIGAHANANTCLRSRFAAVAPFMNAAVTAIIADTDAAVSAAAPPLLSPRSCSSDVGSWLLMCLPSGTAAASPGSRFEQTSGVLLFGAAVGIRGRRGGQPEAHLHAFVCVYVSSSVPALPALLDS